MLIMTGFRIFLGACLITIIGYTSVTIANHGWDLLPIFFDDMAAMGWPGQFNLDFQCFLLLSGLWVAWRHQFRLPGLLLAPVAVVGGFLFLSAYLLLLSVQTRGNIRTMLLGAQA
jgi:hypothetical protein